jgi:ethanolamine ammonia-lyase small subunit
MAALGLIAQFARARCMIKTMSNSESDSGQLPSQGRSSPRDSTFDTLALRLKSASPARIFVGRAGAAYTTTTQLDLRSDHAAAVDAVFAELNPESDFPAEFRETWQLFSVETEVQNKSQYLMRPDLGRRLNDAAKTTIARNCPRETDLQVVIGDGLSAAAVARQAPLLLSELARHAAQRGWSFGRPFVVHYCRVGVLNDLGEVLDPKVVVLLIGERPGLATSLSLSAYLAYRPRAGHTDAQRNLISNIHEGGLPVQDAAARIARFADLLRHARSSGIALKESAGLLPDSFQE